MTFLTLILLLTLQSAAADTTESDKILTYSKSLEWRHVLYAPKGRSMVVNPLYFAEPKLGPTDPRAELEGTLKALRKIEPTHDLHAQCRWPLRYKILKSMFELPAPVECLKLEQWTKSYSPYEMRFVYASQYISNPASVFGHAFLLLPSPTQTEGLWMTFNYAADIPSDENAFSYVLNGVGGGYVGDYTVLPYYRRLHQYSGIENRDLWHYIIKLSPDELDSLLRHLWELVHLADFEYYFFDENCAGVILRTLSVVIPEMRNGFSLPLYVHPVEVIKRLNQIGRLGEASAIPSHFKVMAQKLKRSSKPERDGFYRAVREKKAEPKALQGRISELVIEYASYESDQNKGQVPEELKNIERSAYIAQSKSDMPPLKMTLEDSELNAPHLGTDYQTLYFGAAETTGSMSGSLGYRIGIHGIVDPEAGFMPNSALEAFKIKTKFDQDGIWISEVTLAQALNIQNIHRFDPKGSWRVRVQALENLYTHSQSDLFVRTGGAYGYALGLGQHSLYLFAAADNNFGRNLPQGHLEVGPELGVLLRFNRFKWYTNLVFGDAPLENSKQLKFISTESQGRLTLAKNWTVNLTQKWVRLLAKKAEGNTTDLSLQYFF